MEAERFKIKQSAADVVSPKQETAGHCWRWPRLQAAEQTVFFEGEFGRVSGNEWNRLTKPTFEEEICRHVQCQPPPPPPIPPPGGPLDCMASSVLPVICLIRQTSFYTFRFMSPPTSPEPAVDGDADGAEEWKSPQEIPNSGSPASPGSHRDGVKQRLAYNDYL